MAISDINGGSGKKILVDPGRPKLWAQLHLKEAAASALLTLLFGDGLFFQVVTKLFSCSVCVRTKFKITK